MLMGGVQWTGEEHSCIKNIQIIENTELKWKYLITLSPDSESVTT